MTDKNTTEAVTVTVKASIGNEMIAIGIPPRPAVLERIEGEMRKDDPDYTTLEKLISLDVSVSASLLKIVNSSFFGFNHRIRSVREALSILGLNTVASTIAALSLKKTFAKVPNLQRFWDSSASIAQISGWLVSQISLTEHRIKADEAYTFGLFRDCGIPLLMFNYSDYIDVLKVANLEDVLPFTHAEDEELGVNHAMMGAKLVKEWRLPIEFSVAVEFHHDSGVISGATRITPEISRHFIAISQLAEFLFQRQSNLNKTREWGKLGQVCMEVLDITEADVEELVKAVSDNKIHIEHVL
jgi:HD-like signal output (HDOD) protein